MTQSRFRPIKHPKTPKPHETKVKFILNNLKFVIDNTQMNANKFQHQHNSDIFTSDSEQSACNISRGTQQNGVVLDRPTVVGGSISHRREGEGPIGLD